MERIYFISGLDCANCAAKLERHLREITYFDNVIIDFMAQKLILTAKDTEALQKGLQEALQVIARVEPGVTIAEKAKMKKSRASQTPIRQMTHDAHCGCDHNHEITQDTHCHDEHCSCGHEHHHNREEHTHHHDGYCSCGHEHHHAHEEHIHQHNEHCHCGQEHYHEHEELMYNEISAVAIEHVQKKDGRFTNEMKQGLVKISISTVLFFAALLLDSSSVLQLGVYLLAYFIVGSEVLLRAAKNILRGQVFDENFLMSIATVGAFCIGEYPEGVMVMLLYQLGELFQNYAVQRSRRSIAELMDIKPEVAHIKMSGQYIDVEPEEVTVGDIIQVRP
ncbi:MAG: heavy metal translocating P-type ATPase, partial [Peptococcaceae bacterium]|nr:heavy metal translocating P-type ATPase [Peptococcaceae bacterium]